MPLQTRKTSLSGRATEENLDNDRQLNYQGTNMTGDLEKLPFQSVLTGKRICLIRSNPEFTDSLWRYILRDRDLRGSSWRWLNSAAELKEYLQQRATDVPEKEMVYLIQKENEIIGTFHIHTFNYPDHKAEIGYAIEKTFEGCGYVSEALALVEAELSRVKFHKLVINCDVENARSIKLAERNGYRREGTLIHDCIENGKFRDAAIFGKLISNQSSGESWVDEVKAARQSGSFENAIELLTRELSKRPDDPQIHYQIAWTHDSLGKEIDAIPAYERAIELGLKGNDLKGAYLGLGSTYRTLGKYEKSREVFERALVLFPHERVFQVFMSLTLFNLNETAKSVEILIHQLVETTFDDSIRSYKNALLFYSDKLGEVFD